MPRVTGQRGREKPALSPDRAESSTTTRNEGFERHRPFSQELDRARLYGIAYGFVLGFLAALCAWGLWAAMGNPAAWALREVR